MTRVVLTVALAASSGCSTFASVRPAEVRPGPTFTVQASLSTVVPDMAAWFWSFDCATACRHAVPAVGLEYMHGIVGTGVPVELGIGMAGAYPYGRVYAQMGRGERPWGAGIELGIPYDDSWMEHRLFARLDLPLRGNQRVLLNGSLFLHAGNSPNGQNPGHFVALVPAAGVLARGRRVSAVPAVALAMGRGERESYGQALEPFTAVFAVFSVSLMIHRSTQ